LGVEVSSLEFADVNGDKKDDIIVCWDSIANSSNHELAIYEYKAKKSKNKLNCFYSGITVNNYIALDMTGDEVKDLLLFEITSGSVTRAKAELYSFSDDKARLRGETKLDAHISSYEHLQIEEIDGKNRVYADAVKTDGSSMLTELIYWSGSYNTIISPFYSYSSGVTSGTTRSVLVTSRDINGDGRIEIPCDKEIENLPETVSCTDWRIYKNTTLITTNYSLSPKDDGYLVIIPNKVIDKIGVNYNANEKLMTVISKEDKKEIFSIKVVLKAKYSEEQYEGFTNVFEDKGYCYLAKTGNSEKIKISMDELKKYIKAISREE
ncbi:MAG: hypothetical protein IKF64_06100, partial [Eubacterium sp.]|nr:hypothetical protein [Eubacterium sp.]